MNQLNKGSVQEGEQSRKVALIVGAQGVIGRNLVDHLATLPDWDIIGLSRRGGVSTDHIRHVAVDLLDRDDSRKKLGDLTQVTHIFYAAYQDRPTWAELVPPNLAMLTNVIEAVEPIALDLQHISLMQGYKVYGGHLGPFKTPARETDAGHMPPEFMVDQQVFLELVGDSSSGGLRLCARQSDESCDGDCGLCSNYERVGATPTLPRQTRGI